jgi:hypothetical protein
MFTISEIKVFMLLNSTIYALEPFNTFLGCFFLFRFYHFYRYCYNFLHVHYIVQDVKRFFSKEYIIHAEDRAISLH